MTQPLAYRAPWHTRAWAWIKAHWYVPVATLVAIVGLAIFAATGGKAGRELLRADKKIRERRKKADEEIRELEEKTEREIQEVEAEHADAIINFEQEQAAEYERVRQRGPAATAAWLNDFDRRMR